MTSVVTVDRSRELVRAVPTYFESSMVAGEIASSLEKQMQSVRSIVSGAAETLVATKETKLGNASIEKQLVAKLSSLKLLISTVSMYFDNGWRVSLNERLDEMLSPADWDVDDIAPSERSFSTFLRMMIYLHPSKRPGIGLTGSGNFAAAWSRNKDRIVIECMPFDEVRWVLFREIEDGRESGAGKCLIHRIPDVIAAYEPEGLFQSGDKVII